MESLPKRIALVYDRVNKWGGAERVLLALHELFPGAPLYTSVYDRQKSGWAEVFPRIIPSFLNYLPVLRDHHELIPFLTPVAFESFNFQNFDAVISVTSAEAKGVITRPDVFHCCYCLTPTRYLYSHHQEYRRQLGPLLDLISTPVFNYLKMWDKVAMYRPDSYIAISRTVRQRINDYYFQTAPVVYPPVDVEAFSGLKKPAAPGGYFLWVGRFVPYKHPEIVIEAFNKLNLPLVMVGSGRINWGSGSFENHLKKIAGPNISILQNITWDKLISLYRSCRAFVFYHEEDFGITAVEAMAAGVPVIALQRGGGSETVIDGVTGIFGQSLSVESLVDTISRFKGLKYQSDIIQGYARKYSLKRFNREFVKVFSTQWQTFKNISTS